MNKATGRNRVWTALIFAVFTALVFIGPQEAFAEEETSNAVAYFCGKRGDLTAPQCAVLKNELRTGGEEGHVLVCNPSEKTWRCISNRCDEISGIVSMIPHKINLNDHLRLCDLVCGTCKTGWK
mgnify:CR=1 FL=1